MKRTELQLSLIASTAVLLLAFQNCSPAGFADLPPPSEGGLASEAGTEDPAGNPENPVPVVETNIPIEGSETTSNYPLPKLEFDYNYCDNNSTCEKTMKLSRPDDRVISFEWKTNENLANQKPETYCAPVSGYTPTSGAINYPAGETKAVAVVLSKVCASEKQIPITIFNCRANGTPFSCSVLVN